MFEKEKIDKGTPIPLYFQLKNIILKYINEGNLKPGDSISTEMELAQIFDISRTTIRQAITELVMEGYLTRVKSKGTFVQRPPIRQEYIRSVTSRVTVATSYQTLNPLPCVYLYQGMKK